MDAFKKLHGRRSEAGVEVRILRQLPVVTVVGSLLPVTLALLARALVPETAADAAKTIRTVDILAIATEVTFLTAMFTVGIGAAVVHIMKGPAYVADAYPVAHAARPAQRDDCQSG